MSNPDRIPSDAYESGGLRERLFKDDHPRRIDRFIDFFGATECRTDEAAPANGPADEED